MTSGHGPESDHPWWCVMCNREAEVWPGCGDDYWTDERLVKVLDAMTDEGRE